MDGQVNLGADLESYVEGLVREGGFASRDEVIREGVRLVWEREKAAWLADLDVSIRRGIADSEAGRVRDLDEVTARLRGKYQAMAKAREAR